MHRKRRRAVSDGQSARKSDPRVAQPGRARWREERSLEAQARFLNRKADKPSNRTRVVYARFLAAANTK